MSDSWRPKGGVTWAQIAVLATLLSLGVGVTWAVPNAIQAEGRRATEAAQLLVKTERAAARREFATQRDVSDLQGDLRTLQVKQDEAIRILRKLEAKLEER